MACCHSPSCSSRSPAAPTRWTNLARSRSRIAADQGSSQSPGNTLPRYSASVCCMQARVSPLDGASAPLARRSKASASTQTTRGFKLTRPSFTWIASVLPSPLRRRCIATPKASRAASPSVSGQSASISLEICHLTPAETDERLAVAQHLARSLAEELHPILV